MEPPVSSGTKTQNSSRYLDSRLRIIHFNDVYEIEHRDDAHPGAAKFANAVKQRYHLGIWKNERFKTFKE